VSVQHVQQSSSSSSSNTGPLRDLRPVGRVWPRAATPAGRIPGLPAGCRTLLRCPNPECRLQGYRVWVDVGTAYVCDCGTEMARAA
jgi:hypothetical protein